MKVLDLLEEIEEICDTSAGVPLTNKIMVDKAELLEIVDDIRKALPDEIQQAQFIKDERERILNDAKEEYETIIKDAEQRAEVLVDQNEITTRSKQRAKEIEDSAAAGAKQLKMSTYDYVDKVLYDFQEKMEYLNGQYFGEMYTNLQNTFQGIGDRLVENRNEIRELSYKTQMDE
ncbi:MAG: ATPase [Clostridiales Family XIII bacterium]|jgi:vacuolar-type H+-ATPase subunit H|nr:ATPase [Clostridiales Family XIII bacterium]